LRGGKRQCSNCGRLGHYVRTCPDAAAKRGKSYKDSIRSSKAHYVFVDALRDFLGLKPLYGNAVSGRSSA
jgi:hypothetical protein